ncbi:putative methanogenesis marker 16 metalloprotein [Methanococcus voltae PS]|uniref:Methanogenesis marker 16 metalloprotein n=1 Tax=Methanococcus voltae PS TaxID=523842 RepID=A0ABT2EX96_METVO|nr:methanogenesis marker 16 metalloprotein [Methanococcus voltae]MCS3921535.1 putative methanogenesis marker 16 metalloprotein [Methanococcus voltae PS]
MENCEKIIVTVEELKKMVKNNEEDKINEVDVVTCGTCGIMSGTMAIMHIPMGQKFRKAEKFTLNGINCNVGPCPNEYLGSVDITVNGTTHTEDYGGGFLFKDLIAGKEVVAKAYCDNVVYEKTLTLSDIPTAELIGTRMAFKNYVALTNLGEPVNTIFHRVALKKGEASFSGCGEYNPLQNMETEYSNLFGKKILLNGSEGLILGYGTRYSAEKPNLMISADMHNMDDYYIGGFHTSAGAEIYDTVAVPIEMNDKNKEYLMTIDDDIVLPLTNVLGRELIKKASYGEAWNNTDLRPKVDLTKCTENKHRDGIIPLSKFCEAVALCPTKALENGIPSKDCFGCGVCATVCHEGVYSMNMNTIGGIPITCRQSDRVRALALSKELKKRIEKGEFKL